MGQHSFWPQKLTLWPVSGPRNWHYGQEILYVLSTNMTCMATIIFANLLCYSLLKQRICYKKNLKIRILLQMEHATKGPCYQRNLLYKSALLQKYLSLEQDPNHLLYIGLGTNPSERYLILSANYKKKTSTIWAQLKYILVVQFFPIYSDCIVVEIIWLQSFLSFKKHTSGSRILRFPGLNTDLNVLIYQC